MEKLCQLVLASAALASAATGQARIEAGRALYRAVLGPEPHPALVREVELAVAPSAEAPGLGWYRIRCRKVSSEVFTVWLLADANPFSPASAATAEFLRYIVQEAPQGPIEYRHCRSGKALLPLFDFRGELLPRAESPTDEPLFASGTFLGHRLLRTKVLPPEPAGPPEGIALLVLDPELLIGTGRNFRDDGTGRASPNSDYTYVEFTETDYDDMIAAGFNYFVARGRQVEWVCRRAVFYEGYSPQTSFPQELFRSNFMGLTMFIDEPACRLAGKYPQNASCLDAVRIIQQHVRQKRRNLAYRNLLAGKGIDLGVLKLVEPAVPIWETYVGTAYYQLEAYPYGIVQECRWQIRPGNSDRGRILQRINAEFGTNIPATPANLFTWYYSQMTGAARALGAKWGMSIYGHAEPELRLPSMKLAYDMGASFVWFWTSDHDHHVPYADQLELARQFTEYTRSHPRPRPRELLNRARKAIVLPYGYTLPSCWQLSMFGSDIFSLDRKNRYGIPYKDVLAPAVKEIEQCLLSNVPYDVLPAADGLELDQYDEIVRISQTGAVSRFRPEKRNGQ